MATKKPDPKPAKKAPAKKVAAKKPGAGKIPAPVTVGARSLRWIRQTIVEWLAAGCPDRSTFEANRKGGV